MQNILSLCTKSNAGKRRAIQHLTSEWAVTTVLKYANNQEVSSFPNCRIGLYRDDGLVISNTTPKDTENIKKEICRIFNHNGLRITIVANEKTIDFFEVTFNLNKSTYQPFTKPNTTLKYVHRERNHPPTTTKNIPAGINERLSSLSSDKASFDQATPPYQKALDKCGYRYTLHYEPPTTNKRKIDNGTTYSGTTSYSVKTSAPISDQIPCPSRQAHPERRKILTVIQSRSVTAT